MVRKLAVRKRTAGRIAAKGCECSRYLSTSEDLEATEDKQSPKVRTQARPQGKTNATRTPPGTETLLPSVPQLVVVSEDLRTTVRSTGKVQKVRAQARPHRAGPRLPGSAWKKKIPPKPGSSSATNCQQPPLVDAMRHQSRRSAETRLPALCLCSDWL